MPKFLSNINLEAANDVQFKTTAGVAAGKIEQDGDDLVLSNAVGDVLLGDGASDVYIGDGTNSVDILFEQSGSIKAEDGSSGVTLTLGSSDTTLVLVSPTLNTPVFAGGSTFNNNLTLTTTNGKIIFDYEAAQTGEYTTEVPLLQVDRAGTPITILSRISSGGAIVLGADDMVHIAAGDTKTVVKDNLNMSGETVILSAEAGFTAYGFPSNDTSWANRNEFKFRADSGTASENGLYIGDEGSTQFIDLSRNLSVGTIGSGAITSTGNIRLPNSGKLYTWTDHDLNFLDYDNWQASASGGMTINNVASTGEIYLKSGNALALTLDENQAATFAGTIGSGAITSTGKITGTELEGTSLDINGNAQIDGILDVNSGTTNTVAIFESTDDKAFIRIKDDTTDAHLITKDNKFSIGESSSDYDNFKVDITSGNTNVAGTFTAGGKITGTELEGTSLDINGNADISGNITSAGWTGDVIASSYLDSDTAHLSTTQTFTGIKTFDRLYESYNGTPITQLGTPSVRDMGLFDSMYSCKTDASNAYNDLTDLVFYKQDADGDAWDTVTVSDDEKRRFLRGAGSGVITSNIVIPHGTFKYRVEFHAKGYTAVGQFYLYSSYNGNPFKLHMWAQRTDTDAWEQKTSSDANVAGWPGHTVLPFSTIWFQEGANSSTKFDYIRLEFTPSWDHASNDINLYHGSLWGGYPAGRRTQHYYDQNDKIFLPGDANISGTIGSGAITSTAHVAATEFRPTNIVTNKVVKFNGSALDDANITDTGSLITLGSDTVVSGELEATSLDINGSGNLSGTLTIPGSFATTILDGDNVVVQKPDYSLGGWARSLMNFKEHDGTTLYAIGAYGNNNTFSYGYIGVAYNDTTVRWAADKTVTFGGNVTAGSNSLTAGSLDINGNADIAGNLTVDGGLITIDQDAAGAAFTWKESDGTIIAGQMRGYANRGDIYLYADGVKTTELSAISDSFIPALHIGGSGAASGGVLQTTGSVNIDGDADISGTLTVATISATDYGLDSADIPNNGANTTGSSGSCTGNAATATLATTVTVTDNENTAENNLIAFVADEGTTTGAHGLEMDGNLHYNPSTGLLTSTSVNASLFTGDLTGDVTGNVEGDLTGTADVALTADLATHVVITDNESTNENNQITFIEGAAGSGQRGLESDGDFHYNPSTGTVTATIFNGEAATVATNANLTGHITSTGNATVLGAFSSADLLGALTDETGTGSAVFASNAVLTAPVLGTPYSGNLANCYGINYYAHVRTAGTTAGDTGAGAEIIQFGTGSVVAGKIYQYSGGVWTLANATAESSSSKLLGVARSTNTSAAAAGMCIRGMVTLAVDTTGADGDVLWLKTADGDADNIIPTGNTHIARVIGYCQDNGKRIFFNPDSTFVEITA